MKPDPTPAELTADALTRLAHFLQTGESVARCAFCQEHFPNATRDQVAEHIAKCPRHPMRAVEAELAKTKARLEFFRPKCAQCDAPLDVHPYQCKLYGLCDRCVGEIHETGPLPPTDTTLIDVPPGGTVDLSGVKTRFVQLRYKITSDGSASGVVVDPPDLLNPVTPADFAGSLTDAKITIGGDFEIAPSKTVITAKLSDVRVETTSFDPCPHCSASRHHPDPAVNAEMCPEIPF